VAPKNNFQSSQCASINNGDMLSQVTDVILTAGQSNAAGNQTFYQQNLDVDKQHNQILAWTMPINGSPQWQIADPSTQTWHGFFPRHPNYRNIPNSRAFNHPAFQIAKNIVRKDPCRVVALIATAAPGMPISHWLGDNNDSRYDLVDAR